MQIHELHNPYKYNTHLGMPAILTHDYKTLYVFKDISPKRMKPSKSGNWNYQLGGVAYKPKGVNVVFVSNESLKDISHPIFKHMDIRAIIMDAKRGTRYEYNCKGYSGIGDYLGGYTDQTISIKPMINGKRRKS